MQVRKEICVSGIVQGVGFRPYVYRLATDRQLTGSISNTPAGVTIQIQGPTGAVDDFVSRLPSEAPALARITGVAIRDLPCAGERDFVILSSRVGEHVRTLISPDVACCGDCLRELLDPNDRRFLYPFINCTNCGPRFTIVRHIPYDRSRTSMAVFPMCARCQAEYDDPRNRRFHAQPNACWECGPQLALWDSSGHDIATEGPLTEAVRRIRAGEIGAIKGLGGFHLAVDASNPIAVARLRERKRRVEKPFAVMVPDVGMAASLCELDSLGRGVLLSRQRPIVLLPKRESILIAEAVAPGQRDLGLFLPYTPLHHLLFATGGFCALVMTSANVSEEPIAIDNREAVARLSGLADFFLVHNRDILLRCDDSVVRPAAGRVRHIRRSRGYVPQPVQLHRDVPQILAVGGELKNTICLARGSLAFLSQHVGDLENAESFDFFQEAVEHLSRVLEIEPAIIAHDLHPDYFSTKWALAHQGVRRVGIQHHHAHIAACMAENRLEGKVIGIALDGTGYGADGKIWGGEVLVADYAGFERAAHLAYLPLPGGSAAIREPWRMAVSYLAHTFGRAFLDVQIPFVRELDPRKVDTLLRVMDRNLNSPLTSSCGRLFDAVAALIGIRAEVNYEAQAAMELEAAAWRAPGDAGAYPLAITRGGPCWQIDARPLFEAIVSDLQNTAAIETISKRFHNGVVEVLVRVARSIREDSRLKRVCLSGGTFQNAYLLEHMIRRLTEEGFEVFSHAEVPAGDGGLSLGQAMIAAYAPA